MTKKLRWGILGVAKINERLLPAFKKATNAELVGIASRSLQKAHDAAKETECRLRPATQRLGDEAGRTELQDQGRRGLSSLGPRL